MSIDLVGKIREWRNDPLQFVWDNFGSAFVGINSKGPDPWQANALKAFPGVQRLAMKACKGPGKTCLLAWLAWNFLATRPQPNMAAVSVSNENLRDGLWKEMAKWQQYSPFLMNNFVFTKTRIFEKAHPNTWWLSARAWSKTADPQQQADALAGLHADYLLFILDEAGGIPDSVMATAEAGLSTGIETKIVIAGNPTMLSGPLYRACTSQRHLWELVQITGNPDDPNRSPRISIEWAKEQIEQYGRDNPWVLVNVFGEFPPSSLNVLLGPDECEAAMKRKVDESELEGSQMRLGVDVARFGDDRTVIFPRRGLLAYPPIVLRNLRSNEVAAQVMLAAREYGAEVILVDDSGGFGGGVVDSLLQGGLSPIAVNFAGKAADVRYLNKRAEMWLGLRDWVQRGGILPSGCTDLIRELTTATYTFSNGKFQIEDKKMIKSRLGYSPDLGDGLALTFGIPEMNSKQSMLERMVGGIKKRLSWDYDPFSDERMG